MPMLGDAPFKYGNMTIRKSLSVERGMQAFWTSKDGGYGLKVDWIGNAHPELVGLCDVLVLNPLDYEAVKKSVQETPARDRARQSKARSVANALNGFNPLKHYRDSIGAKLEEARSKS